MNKGDQLGPYTILEPLGAGGMGEVYRAEDTRLKRDVAIKVLPAELADDAERLARLEREAQLLAQLEHPNVAAIHGLEETDGVRFLVMQLAEGETLAARIAAGPIAFDESLAIAEQIAAGLESAHEKGIVHRDLKAGNVMVAEDASGGLQVKILDFGLAKAHEADGSATEVSSDLSASPTAAIATRAGIILGTAAYMSPEQARGRPADRRTDIWAFGCVLYEMLTGRTAFGGRTAADTMASILKEEPDWSALPASVAPAIRRLLSRCLDKDPKRRFRDIGDVWLEITEAAEHPAYPERLGDGVAPARPHTWQRVLPWAITVVVASAAIWANVGGVGDVGESPLFVSILGPLGTRGQYITISPDGARLVMVAVDARGAQSLWVRDLDAVSPRPLPGTQEGTYPFWSPDSQTVAFFADGKLKSTPATGGPVRELADAPNTRSGTWGPDGTIVFATAGVSGLSRISGAGADAVPLTTLDLAAGDNSHRYPSFLPDGHHVLYFNRNEVSPDRTGVWVAPLDGGPARQLIESRSLAVYAPPGFLLYRDGINLLAHPFDAETRTFNGDPQVVVDDVWFDPSFSGLANFTASNTGMLLYRGGGMERTTPTWLDRAGRVLGAAGQEGNYLNLYLSSADGFLAVSQANERTETRDLWVLDPEGESREQLTFNPASDFAPLWVDEDSRIVFSSDREGTFDVYEQGVAAGGADVTRIFADDGTKWLTDVSPDGNLVLMDHGDQDIWVLDRSSGEARPFKETEVYEWSGRFSPDGNWIAYISNELGPYEVFVERFPAGGHWRVSTDGGFEPVWNPQGGELFYLAPDGTLMAAEYQIRGDQFVRGRVESLFPTRVHIASVVQPDSLNHYDVAMDGERFLILRQPEDPPAVMLILNWTAALRE